MTWQKFCAWLSVVLIPVGFAWVYFFRPVYIWWPFVFVFMFGSVWIVWSHARYTPLGIIPLRWLSPRIIRIMTRTRYGSGANNNVRAAEWLILVALWTIAILLVAINWRVNQDMECWSKEMAVWVRLFAPNSAIRVCGETDWRSDAWFSGETVAAFILVWWLFLVASLLYLIYSRLDEAKLRWGLWRQHRAAVVARGTTAGGSLAPPVGLPASIASKSSHWGALWAILFALLGDVFVDLRHT